MLVECLLFGIIVAVLILIISLTVGIKETMTRIRRTVGTYNSADEVQLPGVITSMPIMDYRHVWTDGLRVYSCDECPSKNMCPKCPKFQLTSIEGFSGGESKDLAAGPGEGAGDNSSDVSANSVSAGDTANIHTDALISLDAPVRLAETIEAEFRPDELNALGAPMVGALGPAYDLDPEFISSRARMGAGCGTPCNRSKVSIRGLTYDTASLGTRNDDLFDGDRKVVCTNNGAGKSSLKILYTNTMGLTNPPPFTASCEFMGPQGYLYKETCALGATYPA
jgi:hypothetical protein